MNLPHKFHLYLIFRITKSDWPPRFTSRRWASTFDRTRRRKTLAATSTKRTVLCDFVERGILKKTSGEAQAFTYWYWWWLVVKLLWQLNNFQLTVCLQCLVKLSQELNLLLVWSRHCGCDLSLKTFQRDSNKDFTNLSWLLKKINFRFELFFWYECINTKLSSFWAGYSLSSVQLKYLFILELFKHYIKRGEVLYI